MASLSNINGLFDVHSTGAILFSTSHGTSGQILRSNGNAAPTWVAASTVIGGPYLPLTGGTLSGALAGTSATFSGILTAQSSSSGDYVRLYGASGTGKWDIYGNGANLRISDNESAGILAVDTGATFGGTVQVEGSNVTVIKDSDPALTVSDTDTNYRGSMRWLSSSNVLEFFTRYAGTYYTNNLVLDRGNVGINNNAPAKKLEISSPTSGDGILLTGDGTGGGFATGQYREIGFSYTDTDTSYGSSIKFEVPDSTNHGGQISFWTDSLTTAPAGLPVRAMTISRSQNVGIGTSSPSYKLEVNGNMRSSTVTVYDGMGGSETGIGASGAGGNLRLYAGGTNRVTVATSAVTLGVYAQDTIGSNYIQFYNSAGTAQGYMGFGASATNDMIISQESANVNIRFLNGGSERMRIDSGGTVTIPGVIESGGGIKLGGTATANKLNDYEEGTWTPSITAAGGNSATATYHSPIYTKVGRIVNVAVYIHTINIAAITSGTYIQITGFPFTAENYGDFTASYHSGGWSGGVIVGGYVQDGANYAYLMRADGGEANQTSTDLVMTRFMLNVTYQTT